MSQCFQYSLFALPRSQLKTVQNIVPQTKLFLYDVDSRELHGVFEATSQGGNNLEPLAFGGSFPSQVRFRICRECKPIPEKDFRNTIEENYITRNKFKHQLYSQQVLGLLKLFGYTENLGENRGSEKAVIISKGNEVPTVIDSQRGNTEPSIVDCRYHISEQSHEPLYNHNQGNTYTVDNLETGDHLKSKGSVASGYGYEGKHTLSLSEEDKVSWGCSEFSECQINIESSGSISSCRDIQKKRRSEDNIYDSGLWKEERASMSSSNISQHQPNISSSHQQIVTDDYLNRRKYEKLEGEEGCDKSVEWSPIRTDPNMYIWASSYTSRLSQFDYPTKQKQPKF